MTQREFESALDQWGANLDAWPDAEARLAREYLADNPQARRTLDAARAVDGFLHGLQDPTVPAHLEQRIRASVAPRPERLLDWFTARPWRPALLALLAVIAGYLLGVEPMESVDQGLTDDVVALAFTDLYAELDDVQQ